MRGSNLGEGSSSSVGLNYTQRVEFRKSGRVVIIVARQPANEEARRVYRTKISLTAEHGDVGQPDWHNETVNGVHYTSDVIAASST